MSEADAVRFATQALETLRWHTQATVSADIYARLRAAYPLVADVVCFRGPHINHLTPRTLDIDRAQDKMPERGIAPKAVIEVPAPRRVPILLRQTSFKALQEAIASQTADGSSVCDGTHTARFGEIEQHGAALTSKGRTLYNQLLDEVRDRVQFKGDGSNAGDYMTALAQVFEAFPDDVDTLRRDGLAYFRYRAT